MSGCITTDYLAALYSELVGSEDKRFRTSNNENDDMMEVKKDNRTKWLHLRLTSEEKKIIMVNYIQSTCRKLSEYARLQLLKKPIIAKYRNQSQDALMDEILALRNELNAIGNNFNQSVKKLHTLQNSNEIKDWIMRYELDAARIASKLDDIKKSIQKIGETWLR